MTWQRLRQFREALLPPTEADFALAREWLSAPLHGLFAAQHPRDVVHSAATARWLLDRGEREPALIQAAFLHDIGKGDQRRWDRAAFIVLQGARLAPLAASHGSHIRMRRALARSLAHAGSSAERMALAGALPRAVELTRRHHGPAGTDRVLALLQQADAAG